MIQNDPEFVAQFSGVKSGFNHQLNPGIFHMVCPLVHLGHPWATHGQVRILQKSTVLEYLTEEELPNRFMEMTSHQTASDAVRLGVLSRYGGAAGLGLVKLLTNERFRRIKYAYQFVSV